MKLEIYVYIDEKDAIEMGEANVLYCATCYNTVSVHKNETDAHYLCEQIKKTIYCCDCPDYSFIFSADGCVAEIEEDDDVDLYDDGDDE